MSKASILITAYNRYKNFKRLFRSIRFYKTKIYISIDGPKNEKDKIEQAKILKLIKSENSNKINYRILYTYSENFGIFPDQYYYDSINETYNFDEGLIQRSALIELIYNRFLKDLNLTIAYGLDNGELLTKTDSFVIKIDYKFKL